MSATGAAAETSEVRRAGRPRSAAVDVAILDAALALLSSEGYGRMSMDAVAANAGVSKATIYLRYSGKADLATAALAHLRVAGRPEPTGELRADLLSELSQLRLNTERVLAMSLVGTCLSEERHTPELMELFRERTMQPRRAILRDLMAEGRARGEIAADADIDSAVDLFMGAYHAHYLSGDPFPDRWEERIVDSLLRGLGAPAA